MRQARCLLPLTGLALAMAALVAAPAAAVPVRYTFTGTLALGSTVDSLDLDGATLTITAEADTDTSEDSTIAGVGNLLAIYENIEATAVFSGRPNSAPDEVTVYTTRLIVDNRFPPSMGNDVFGISTANATAFGQTIGMPAMSVDFADQAFLPGTGAPSLPVFEPSDTASFGASSINNPIRYDVLNVNVTSTVIPEPATALTLAGGLACLAAARRGRARSAPDRRGGARALSSVPC